MIERDFYYQSVWFAVGRLHKGDSGNFESFQAIDGAIPISGVRSSVNRLVGDAEASDWGLWVTYPRTTRKGLIYRVYVAGLLQSSLPEGHPSLTVTGRLLKASEGLLLVKVKRNCKPPDDQRILPHWKGFLITIKGFLPESKPGEIWKLDCSVENGVVSLVDGAKLKEARTQERKEEGTQREPETITS